MLKFFRRYNKAILMVGGSILMVLFLLPTTATQVGGRSFSATAAHIDGRRVTVADLIQTAEDLDLLQKLMPQLLAALGIDHRGSEHWLLLVHEAERAGLVGGPRDAREGLPKQLADAISAAGRGQESVAERAIARMKGVMRLLDAYNVAGLYSTQEAVQIGKTLFDSATVGVVTIPAETISSNLPDPGEDRLRAHFDRYKDVDPAEDPDRIGYRRPKAVRLEWFSIDRRALEAACPLDPIEVNMHWRRNQSRFTGEFSAVRLQVEQDLRKQKVDQALARAADLIRRELFRSTAGLPQDGNYKTLPPDWAERMPRLAWLAEQAEAELRRQLPALEKAVSVWADDGQWRSFADLARMPGIGPSYIRLGADQYLPFSSYVMAARELGGAAQFGVQAGLVLGPLEDGFGSYFYVRLLETRGEGPPPSLDDVRDAVVRDVKILDALAKLREDAETIRRRAVEEGLQKLAEGYGVSVRWSVQVTERHVRASAGGTVDPYLDAPELREPIMAVARQMDPLAPPESMDADQRTIAVVVPKARGLVVAQVLRFRPMTREQFAASAGEIHRQAILDLGARKAIDALSFDSLRRRHDFRPVRGRGAETDEGGPFETDR